MKRVFWALLVFVLLGVLLFAMRQGFGKNPRTVPFKLLGQAAPAFSIPTLEGGQLGLEALRGRPVVINFWSSWCAPCAEEAPALEKSYQKWGQKVAFVGVVFEDSEANARNFLRRHPASYPQLFSPVSTMAIDYAVTGVPETYFLDEQGKIIGRYASPIPTPEYFDFLLLDFRMQSLANQNPQLKDALLKEALQNPSALSDSWLKEALLADSRLGFLLLYFRFEASLRENPKHRPLMLKNVLLNPSALKDSVLGELLLGHPELKDNLLHNAFLQYPNLKATLLKDAQVKEALSQNPRFKTLFLQGASP